MFSDVFNILISSYQNLTVVVYGHYTVESLILTEHNISILVK